MYHTDSIVVGLAGDLKAGNGGIDNLVAKYFGQVATGPQNFYEPTDDKQKKPAVLAYFKQSDQAHLCLGVRGYPLDHPDRYALGVLATLLGGNMSSRLFLEVREKRGLAYYVNSGTEEFHDAGYLVSQSGLKISAVSEAIGVILEQYAILRDQLVSEEELRRAKDFWKGRMVLALEDSYRVASFYTIQEVLERKMETPEEVLAKVEAVTAEDIQRVAKDVFINQKLNLAIVGPFKEEDQFAKLLSL